MSTIEAIAERTTQLPPMRQAEVLDFVEFLLNRERVERESADWSSLAGSQLAAAYADSDSIYDQP